MKTYAVEFISFHDNENVIHLVEAVGESELEKPTA